MSTPLRLGIAGLGTVGVGTVRIVQRQAALLTARTGREITISALREWMSEIGERTKVKVSVIGKVKTTAQMVSILLLLFKSPIGPFPTHDVGMILIYVAAVLTLWSMLVYMRAAWPVIVGNSS